MKTLILILMCVYSLNAQPLLHFFFDDEAFSPLDIAGLAAWYDGANVTKDGDTVETVIDLSGNGNTLTKTFEATQGYFTIDAINGKPSLKVTANSPELKIASNLDLNLFTIFCVGQRGSTSSNGYLTFSGAAGYFRYTATGTGSVVFGATYQTAANTMPSGGTHYFEIVSNGATIEIKMQGSLIDTTITDTNSANWNFASIGVTTAGDNNNENGETIIYNVTLTADQRTQIRTYLNNKYAFRP